ncbi:PAP2 superfamily [Mycobacteroides abscessus subsp. abscessus]|nr:PAP2 superfamily [Mycobacteroides abscessus subsp. abscessus]
MVGIILYLLIVYFLVNHMKKKSTQIMIGITIGVLVLLVGVSRNVLLAHYPSDVFGGFALGYLWTYVWIIIYELIGKKQKTT